MNACAPFLLVVALASRSAGDGGASYRVDLATHAVERRPPPATRSLTTSTPPPPPPAHPCVALAGDPRNRISRELALPMGGDLCITRAFLPGVQYDGGRDVVEARDATGKRTYQFALAGTADAVVVVGDVVAFAGGGGVLVIEAKTGAGRGFVEASGFASWAIDVEGVVVSHIGNRVLAVDVAKKGGPALLWSVNDVAPSLVHNAHGSRCGAVVVEAVVTRALTWKSEGMPDTHGEIALREIDAKRGVVATIHLADYNQFFDDAAVDVACNGAAGTVDVTPIWIVLD